MKIYTDNKWKPFKYRNEVPKKILKEDFDWLDENEIDGFIKYRNNWYHTSEFMRLYNDPFPSNWHGYSSDSFFSGILIELSEDGEMYKIATYFS